MKSVMLLVGDLILWRATHPELYLAGPVKTWQHEPVKPSNRKDSQGDH